MARVSAHVLLLLLLVTLLASRLQATREEPEEVARTTHDVKPTQAEEEEEDGEVVMPNGMCGYKSKTFSGQCIRRTSCDYKCRVNEHAAAGACHYHHIQRHCYCYHFC